MSSPFLLRILVVAAMSFCLASCGRSESYRYKLTLAVNTPDGAKRGSSVGEVLFYEVSILASGTMHRLSGDALYLDLGPGRRPLIALLTSQLHLKNGKDESWSLDGGPSDNLLSRLYGLTLTNSILDYTSKLAPMRGTHEITAKDLPDLVTFADTNDPKTVIDVDPNDLRATLGAGVSWNKITFEITGEPVSRGIERKLTWLDAQSEGMLDGQKLSWRDYRKTLANTLSAADFRDPYYKKGWW